MEQEGADDMMNRSVQGQGGGQVPPQQPQKCPRCDSFNTKFCYYNNYSLSQPRYFCKACRRYWTQGGTLRNVPVGGGCRRGKRGKSSSSSSSSSADNSSSSRTLSQPAMPHDVVPPFTTAARVRDPSPAAVPYGSGGGYLSSLAAMNQSQSSHPFDPHQFVNSSSNMGLVSGFNVAAAASLHRQIHPSCQFYPTPTGSGEREVMSLFGAEQGLVPPGSNSQNVWPQSQSFLNNNNGGSSNSSSDVSMWSNISSTTSIINNSQSQRSESSAAAAATSSSSSLVNNQWSDLQGYTPPP